MFTKMQQARRANQLAARGDRPARKVANRICNRLRHLPCGYVVSSRGSDEPITISYGRETLRTITVNPDGSIYPSDDAFHASIDRGQR